MPLGLAYQRPPPPTSPSSPQPVPQRTDCPSLTLPPAHPVNHPTPQMAAKVWAQLANVDDVQDVRHTMSRQQYVEAIMPGERLDVEDTWRAVWGQFWLLHALVWQGISELRRCRRRSYAAAEARTHTGAAGAASLDQPPQEMDFGGNAGLIDLGQPSSFATR